MATQQSRKIFNNAKSFEISGDPNNHKEVILLAQDKKLPQTLISHWVALANAGVSAVCEPLRQFGITYVLYVKRFNDGSQIELTNNLPWSEHYYSNAFYAMCPFSNTKKSYDSGIFLWSGLNYQGNVQKFREHLQLDHGVSFVLKYSDCTEFFCFAGDVTNHHLINFYFNQQCIVRRFILYFKDKLSCLIKLAEKKRILLPKPHIAEDNSIIYSEDEFSDALQAMPVKKYYMGGSRCDTYLTQREAECLKWYINGKTACEISMILSISKRTAEVHLENIKRKLDCFKQSQLGYKFSGLVNLL